MRRKKKMFSNTLFFVFQDKTFGVIKWTIIILGMMKHSEAFSCGETIMVSTRQTFNGRIHSSRCTLKLESPFSCSKGIEISSVRNNYYNRYSYASHILHDGPNTSYPVLNDYQGTYRSSSNQVFMKVQNYDYLSFVYQIYNKESYINPENHGCSGVEPINLMATNVESALSSPGFPNLYSNSQRCSWFIRVADPCNKIIKIHIESLHLEKDFDFLHIYEGKNETNPKVTLTGAVTARTFYFTKSVLVVFSTDSRNRDKGFRLLFKQESAFPRFLQMPTVQHERRGLVISVYFVSAFPIYSVTWKHNETIVLEREGTEIFTNVSYSELLLNPFSIDDTGTYKVTLRNERGTSEQIISVPMEFLTDVEFLDVVIDTSSRDTGFINVTFRSSHGYSAVAWYLEENLVNGEKNAITPMSSESFRASLRFDKAKINAYGNYQVNVYHYGGTASRKVFLPYPSEVAPSIPHNWKFYQDEYSTIITAEFTSLLPNPVVRLLHNTTQTLSVANVSEKQHGNLFSFRAEVASGNNTLEEFVVELKNKAGTSRFRKKTHKSIASPHPLRICELGDTISLVCNLGDICAGRVVYWSHKINGQLVRKLHGITEGLTNTLVLDGCSTADSGIYTCIIEAVDSNNSSYIYREKVFSEYILGSLLPDQVKLSVNGLPLVEIVASYQNETAGPELMVKIVSDSPIKNLNWFMVRNESEQDGHARQIFKEISDDSGELSRSLSLQNISISIFNQVISLDGFVSFLGSQDMPEEKFNTYGIEVKNEAGVVILHYELKDPKEGIPSIFENSPDIFQEGDLIRIQVQFHSYPNYTSLVWFKNNIQLQESDKHCMQSHDDLFLDVREDISYQLVAELNISNPASGDYGEYVLKIKNRKGFAESTVYVRNINDRPPFITRHAQVELEDNMTSVHVEFKPALSLVEWKIDDIPVQNTTDIAEVISRSNGSTLLTNSEMKQTSLDVKVSNAYGSFYETFTVLKDCPVMKEDGPEQH